MRQCLKMFCDKTNISIHTVLLSDLGSIQDIYCKRVNSLGKYNCCHFVLRVELSNCGLGIRKEFHLNKENELNVLLGLLGFNGNEMYIHCFDKT